MKLEETAYDNSETGCCARLDAELWDGREHTWNDKPFLKDHMRAFLHVPLDFGSVISRDHAAVQEAGAYPEHPLWLTDEVSPWGADVYVALDREVPGVAIDKLTGEFVSKVFEGPYRHAGRWAREMEAFVADRGGEVKRLLTFYATCPKCAKRFGKNEVVLFAQTK